MRIAIAKEQFNTKISLLTTKLNIELRKKLVRCYVWSRTWTLRKLEWKYLEIYEMWRWRRMAKIKWSENVTNEQVLKRIGQKRTLLNDILHRKSKYPQKNLLPSWCHWRTNERSERSRKKNTAPWWIEKQKMTLGANGRSWRWKKMETTVYQSNRLLVSFIIL